MIDVAARGTVWGLVVLALCVPRLGWLLRRRHERVLTRTQLLISHTRSTSSDDGARAPSPVVS